MDAAIRSFVAFLVVFGLLTYFSTYFEAAPRRPRWWLWALGLAVLATMISQVWGRL